MIEKSGTHITKNNSAYDVALGYQSFDQRMPSAALVCSGHFEKSLSAMARL